jgi:hypothetical protein
MTTHTVFRSCAFALLLAGCGGSSGPVSIGPDTYMLANTGGWSSGGLMKADLYREGAAFCQSKGLNLMTVTSKSEDYLNYVRFAGSELVFRCLPANDPGLVRPRRGADKIIEYRTGVSAD